MKIEDIQIFLNLAETLSFLTTADAMFLSPSAVTYSIKNLEKQLGTKLLLRNSHGVVLTEKGRGFYDDMRKMMSDWNIALEHLREEPEAQRSLRIGTISMTLQKDFSKVISRFIEENPGIQPKLSVCPVEDPSAPLRRGEMDVAFIYQDAIGRSPLLEYTRLVSAPLYCVMSRRNPLAGKEAVTLNDLRGQTLFTLPDEINATVNGIKMLGDRIASLGAEAPTCITTDDHNYCKSMAEADRGMTFEPIYPPTLRNTDTLVWLPFRDPELPLPICMAWRKGRLSPEIRSLISLAKQYFSKSGE